MYCKLCETNKRIKSRTICYQCRYKIEKEKRPMELCYHRLKGHAKERNKEFTLTLEEFKEFCIKTEYISKKGITKDSFHIDRKDETLGYTKDNIQVLTNSQNIKKYIEFVAIQEGNKIFKTKIIEGMKSQESDDVPF